jgi:hypothetical protein
VLIFTSDKGRETFRTLRGLLQSDEENLMGGLSVRETDQLRTLLANLLQAAPSVLDRLKAGVDGRSTKSPRSSRAGSAPSIASQHWPSSTMAKPGNPYAE